MTAGALQLAIDAIAERWPGLAVTADALAGALVDRGVAADSPRAADVALACALAARDRRAIDVFERELVPDIRRALVRIDRAGNLVDDALQQVREKLLVASEPRIVEYRARGSLAAWIQVIAIRELLMMMRKTRRELPDAEPLQAVVERDLARALTKERFRTAFAAAFHAALAALAPRDRALLRLCFVEGAGTEHLARVYGVHRVTMFRWLCDARARLLEETRTRLATATGVDDGDLDSVIRALASSLDLGW